MRRAKNETSETESEMKTWLDWNITPYNSAEREDEDRPDTADHAKTVYTISITGPGPLHCIRFVK